MGRVRSNNEDAFRVVASLNLFVLSDGMGGEAHGERASELAVETVSSHCLQTESDPSETFFGTRRADLSDKNNHLPSAVILPNRKIFDPPRQNPPRHRTAPT